MDPLISTRVARAPCPFLARAWWGEELVAESTAAVRVEEETEEGVVPALYFPLEDVRFDLLRREARTATSPVKGVAELWSTDRPGGGGGPSTGDWGSAGQSREAGGDHVLWRYTEPPEDLEWLAGLAAFDHERVRVELVEPLGDDPRDVTVKRFPTWGDVAHLVDILDVRPEGEGTYVSVARGDQRRPVVEGSQMLGQAIVAAGRHAPGRRAVSAHMVFVRPADAREPLRFELEELSAGRTFTTLGVQVRQGERRRAAGTLLLDATAPDAISHAVEPPGVVGPHEAVPCDMSVTGRDLRVVDAAYTDDPDAPVGPPVIDAWQRYRDVPDDPYLHAGLLAQFTGHMSIAAAMRPHAGVGQRSAHRTLSTAINAISLSLHADVRADRWMLYRHRSTFAGDGMTHSECRVHDEEGALLASFTVDAMVRPFGGPPPADDRTAM